MVGQEPSYIHYGEQEGLPTSEVYQSIQDDRGYMWFATDRGLVRFDGIDFKVFGKEDGLVSDVIFGFHRDYQGRIWFYSHFGGVGYLQGDRIVIPPFNDRLIEVLAGNVVVSIYLDQQRNLWIASKSNKFHGDLVCADGKVEAIKHVGDSAMFWIQELDSLGFVYGNGVLKHPQTVRYFQNEREFTFDFP
ncbi:MAG: two-component regulator propeller domain-containing protein, partial [Salibacteraceae bacterium]